ncbi:hypothetical protein C2S51_006613 [Perilla frutescens var. frutescens]|nr:hypothetical protein C2S51_006613 [Perilla frutescens var. frutescens]
MAATAYAAAVSLLNTMDDIKIHPLLSIHFKINYPIESLREKVDFFVDFVEKYSDAESREAEDLFSRIADAAHEAEETINVEAAHRVRAGSTGESHVITTGKLEKITQEMDCVKENAMNAKEETGFRDPYSPPPPASSSAPPPPYSQLPLASSCATMKGFAYAEDLMRRVATVARKAMPHKLQRKKKVMDYNKVVKAAAERTGSSVPPSSSSIPPATAMVGFDGYMEQLLDQLTGHHPGRQILPIVGMGGIGKTTLATNVYHNSNIMRQFKYRVWITVSQKFSPRKIYLQALSCLGISTGDVDTYNDQQLSDKLYKFLYDRRYLVVLDDVWSVEAWEKIMFFFPENNNKSRIVVTTRQQELVDYFGSSVVTLGFLDEKNSWELFCEKTFAEEGCPPELEEIGKEIVKKCKGLPLAITVFGGLLRKSPPTRKYWERIAKDRSLILDSEEGSIKPLSIFYLSYKHLPVWLKPCFLYLGLYPEDHEIDVPELIKLWVAEGFIRSKTEQSLEEVGESYTKELVDRNLLLVRELRLDKKLKSFRVHDIVRELCIRTGEREKYFCVRRDIDGMRHSIVDEATARLFYPRESQETPPSIVHPLILERERAKLSPKSRLLKVSLVRDRTNLGSYSQDVNLRYFYSGFEDDNAIHSSMQLFWSLQTLIIRHMGKTFDAPLEIWKMPQLRHIDMISISIPDPPSPTCEDDVIVLQNLQTLTHVKNLVLSEEVCKRIPNIKELSITYKFNDAEEASRCNSHLQNLGRFDKLETLQLYSNYPGGDSLLRLPSSITRLLLYGCKLEWSDMAMIASLPHLLFLELFDQAFVGGEWNLGSEEFLCLKRLRIVLCGDLIHWNITSGDSSNFPVLETLELAILSKLEEIPSVMGEIPTLERIDLKGCNESVNMSAIEILEEHESYGNRSLKLTLYLDNEDEAVMWRDKIQELGITCQNLHFHTP